MALFTCNFPSTNKRWSEKTPLPRTGTYASTVGVIDRLVIQGEGSGDGRRISLEVRDIAFLMPDAATFPQSPVKGFVISVTQAFLS